MKKHKVASVRRVCTACPTTWEGVTDGGQEVYARYRWGYLRVEVADEQVYGEQIEVDDEESNRLQDEHTARIFSKDTADQMIRSREQMRELGLVSYAGVMDYDELRRHTSHLIDWPESET